MEKNNDNLILAILEYKGKEIVIYTRNEYNENQDIKVYSAYKTIKNGIISFEEINDNETNKMIDQYIKSLEIDLKSGI